MDHEHAIAEALDDGTILIEARGQKVVVTTEEVKSLLKQLVVALAESKIKAKQRENRERSRQ